MAEWSMSEEQREFVKQRIREGLENIAFVHGKDVSGYEAIEQHALNAEKEAYDEVQANKHCISSVLGNATYASKAADAMLAYLASMEPTDSPASDEGRGGFDLDLHGPGREFVDGSRAEELLSPLLSKSHSQPVKIRLSSKSFGQEAANAVAQVFKERLISGIRVADLSDIIAGRPEDEALEVLAIITSSLPAQTLTHLNLSDNALGEKGMRACKPAFLDQANLESISLENVGLSQQACQILSEYLSGHENIKKLRLYNNMSGNEGAFAIADILSSSTGIEEFRMASSRVGHEGGAALTRSLSSGSSLRKLDLSDNPLMEETAGDLAIALGQHKDLAHLYLNDCGLESEGTLAIMKAIVYGIPELQTLHLGGNDFGGGQAEELYGCLKSMHKLESLNLAENQLTDEEAAAIAYGLEEAQAPITHIDVSENEMTDDGAMVLARFIASMPETRAHFQELILSHNDLTADGVDQLKATLQEAGKEDVASWLQAEIEDEL